MKTLLLATQARLFTRNAAIISISSLLAALFIYTGANKLLDHDLVRSQLSRSPFIQSMSGFLSLAIPIGELFIAVLLSIPPMRINPGKLPPRLARMYLALPSARLVGLYLSFLLMALFTGYVYIMLTYAYDLPCSCGGVLASLSWQNHLYFNVGFTLLTATGILFYPSPVQQGRTR